MEIPRMTEPLLKTVSSDGILELRLNRPEALNALNSSLLDELQVHLYKAKTDKAIKALLLHGEGKTFSAGADIKQLTLLNAQTGYAFAKRGQAVFNLLETLGKPSLAAIHGFALGGGC